MKKPGLILLGLTLFATSALADDYVIDKKGMHAFIQFRVSHLGFSWLYGRFNDFGGEFSYNKEDPSSSSVVVTINPASVDTNHAERDKHVRSEDFLYVDKYPEAKFVSTSFNMNEDGTGTLTGDFTLRGITKPVTIAITRVGEGADPWGGYRVGFEGKTSFALADYGIPKDLGPTAKEVELTLSIEGVKQ